MTKCDECGVLIQRLSNYDTLGWFTVKQSPPPDQKSARTTAEWDFCSTDCMIRHLVPDLEHRYNEVLQEKGSRLLQIEADLLAPQ